MSLEVRAISAAENEVVKPALSQAVGYIVVVLIGLIIAFSIFQAPCQGEIDAHQCNSHDVRHAATKAYRRRRQQEDRNVRYIRLLNVFRCLHVFQGSSQPIATCVLD